MVRMSGLVMSFGSQVVFDDVAFTVNRGERIGLVGRNGSGKSTLFNILCGRVSCDAGTITFPKDYRIGYAEQRLRFTESTALAEGCSVLEPERGGETWYVEKVLAGLGFSDADMVKDPGELSGGFQVRLALAKVLVARYDLLLLDEPTNYLDIVAIRWLARFLRGWPGELILITHDRGFMDSVVTHTMIIHRKKLRKMTGGTEKLYDQIIKEEEIYEKTRLNDERKRREMDLFITRFRAKARLANLVQSRIKTLSKRVKLERLEKIPTLDFSFAEAPFPAKYLMEIRNLDFSYGHETPPAGARAEGRLIEGLNLLIGKKDRIGIVGKNGKGKTTLLRLLEGELDPVSGEVLRHQELAVGYFGQTNIDRLEPSRTVEEEILSVNPDGGRKKAMDICGAMMFSDETAGKKVGVLSGGERSRVLLGKLLASPSNLLLLDEPSNHLDMESCDSLMAAIDSFNGAVLIVTHNETFLHSLVERLVVFGDKGVRLFEGNYEEFLENGGWGDNAGAKNGGMSGRASFSGALSSYPLAAPSGGNGSMNARTFPPGGGTQVKKELKRARAQIIAERGRALTPIVKTIAEDESAIEKLEAKVSENNRRMIEASSRGGGKAIQELAIENHTLQETIRGLYSRLEDALGAHEKTTAVFNRRLEELV